MSRLGITFEQVEQVANAILQAGQNPTIERIRSQLGTGSASTISKYLLIWRNKRAHGYEMEISTSPPDPVNQAVTKVWQQLQAENQAKLEALEEEAKHKIQLAQEEKELVLDELHSVKEDNQQLHALLKEVREQNEEFAKEQIRLNQILAVLESTCKTVEESDQKFQQFANQTLTLLETKYQQVVMQYEVQLTQNKKFYTKELSQMKEIAENQRHEHIVEIDHLKTANQKLQMQLAEKDKIQLELSSRVGRLSSQLQNQQDNVLELLAKLQKNEKQAEAVKSEIIANVAEAIQSTLEKQTKILLSLLQQQISELKMPVKVKQHEPVA